MHRKPIFYDPTGRRASHVSRLGLALAVVSTLLVVACAVSLFVGPSLGVLQLHRHEHGLHGLTGTHAKAPQLIRPAERLAAEVRARERSCTNAQPPRARRAGSRAAAVAGSPDRPAALDRLLRQLGRQQLPRRSSARCPRWTG